MIVHILRTVRQYLYTPSGAPFSTMAALLASCQGQRRPRGPSTHQPAPNRAWKCSSPWTRRARKRSEAEGGKSRNQSGGSFWHSIEWKIDPSYVILCPRSKHAWPSATPPARLTVLFCPKPVPLVTLHAEGFYALLFGGVQWPPTQPERAKKKRRDVLSGWMRPAGVHLMHLNGLNGWIDGDGWMINHPTQCVNCFSNSGPHDFQVCFLALVKMSGLDSSQVPINKHSPIKKAPCRKPLNYGL